MGVLYRVKDWADNFENNRTKDLKHMQWVPVPNRMDGDGYTQLVDHPNGAAHFGAWMAIVEIASRCHPRGTLLRDSGTLLRGGGKPHDSTSLARLSRLPAKVFDEVIPRLVEIGWLVSEVVVSTTDTTIPQEGAGKPQEGAAIPQDAARNGMEWKRESARLKTKKPKEEKSQGPHVPAVEHYQEGWKAKYGADKCVIDGRDWKAAHELHGILDGDTERLNRIIDTFLEHRKPYYLGRKHKLYQLREDINDFLATGPPRVPVAATVQHTFEET